jgi:hypothetical protein
VLVAAPSAAHFQSLDDVDEIAPLPAGGLQERQQGCKSVDYKRRFSDQVKGRVLRVSVSLTTSLMSASDMTSIATSYFR